MACQCQRLDRGFSALDVFIQDPECAALRLQRTALLDGVAQRCEDIGRPLGIGDRGAWVDPACDLGARQTPQTQRLELGLAAAARRFERGRSRRYGCTLVTETALHERLAAQRARQQRDAGLALGQRLHRLRVGGGALQVAHGDVALRAEIEERHALVGFHRLVRQRGGGGRDGVLVLAGPGQVDDLLRGHLSDLLGRPLASAPPPGDRRGSAWSDSRPCPRRGTSHGRPALRSRSSRRCGGDRSRATSR